MLVSRVLTETSEVFEQLLLWPSEIRLFHKLLTGQVTSTHLADLDPVGAGWGAKANISAGNVSLSPTVSQLQLPVSVLN